MNYYSVKIKKKKIRKIITGEKEKEEEEEEYDYVNEARIYTLEDAMEVVHAGHEDQIEVDELRDASNRIYTANSLGEILFITNEETVHEMDLDELIKRLKKETQKQKNFTEKKEQFVNINSNGEEFAAFWEPAVESNIKQITVQGKTPMTKKELESAMIFTEMQLRRQDYLIEE